MRTILICNGVHGRMVVERGENKMEYLDVERRKDADPQAVLGATLCMMSCTMQSGCQIYLRSIAENLEWLSAIKTLDENFRRLCRRLAIHWETEAAQHERVRSNEQAYETRVPPSVLKH